MGVIHKLKNDVIAYILEQKKANPTLGVRKLAEITSEHFQTKVSKSSVNSVLKSAALSSSVGRRPGSAVKPSKFKIPSSRKLEISSSMGKAGFKKEDLPVEPSPPPKSPPEQNTAPNPGQAISEQEISDSIPLMPDPIAPKVKEPLAGEREFLAQVNAKRSARHQRENSLKGLGHIFLKAAQWETSGKSLFTELFKKHVSGSMQDVFMAACEMYAYLRHFGVDSFERVTDYQDHGLWQLNSIKGRNLDESEFLLKMKDIFMWGEAISPEIATSIIVKYEMEKRYALTEASGFDLLLEDGSKMELACDLSNFEFGSIAPINKAMTWLSDYLISNIKPLVFHAAPGEGQIDQKFYDAISILENLPGRRMQGVSVLDAEKNAIANFSAIPAQKRSFAIGIKPSQKEFALLVKNARFANKRPFYHEETDSMLYYGDFKSNALAGNFDGKIKDFRIMALWKDRAENPFWAILTNMAHEQGERIISAYCSRWPNADFALPEAGVIQGAKYSNVSRNSDLPRQLGFGDLFGDYFKNLSRYCQYHYFPTKISDMDKSQVDELIYDLSGTYYESETYVCVALEVPEASPCFNEIRHAAEEVNRRHIFDYFDRKIWVTLKSR